MSPENIIKTRIRDLLYTPGQWGEVAKGKGGQYTVAIVNSQNVKQLAYFFSANHSFDPNNEQYEKLRSFWKQFTEHADNPIVFMEGGIHPVLPNDEVAIRRESESGLITRWAHELNISIRSAEPPDLEQMQQLSLTFSRDEIAYYHFIRSVHQWLGQGDNMKALDVFIGKTLEHYGKVWNWNDFDFSLEHMKQLHRTFTGSDFDSDLASQSRDYFLNIFISIKDTSVINRIGSELATLRNIHMVALFLEAWQQGYSIFASLGGSHVILQERAVRTLL